MNQLGKRTVIRVLVAATFTALLTGCAHTPRGYVAKEWSTTMRELGIIPVFPPREDVQVGDVYLAPLAPDAEFEALKREGFLPVGVWLAHLNLEQEAADFYGQRPSFPPTPSATADFMTSFTNKPFAALAQAADTNRNVFRGGDTNRLRMVGFPSFMSATFNKGDLAGVVPVEAVNVAFGAGFSAAKSATVTIPVAESYGLPADQIWPKLMTADGKLIDFAGIPRSQLHHLVNNTQVVHEGTNYYAPLRVITEVFYARALDISVASQTTRGFGVSGRPIGSPDLKRGAATNGTFVMPGVTNLGASAIERAAEMNRALEQSMGQMVPGGSVKFVAAGDRGVSMRRTYDRPIAIGYRALHLFVPLSQAPADRGTGTAWTPTATGGSFISPVTTSTNAAPVPPGGQVPVKAPASQPGKPKPGT